MVVAFGLDGDGFGEVSWLDFIVRGHYEFTFLQDALVHPLIVCTRVDFDSCP